MATLDIVDFVQVVGVAGYEWVRGLDIETDRRDSFLVPRQPRGEVRTIDPLARPLFPLLANLRDGLSRRAIVAFANEHGALTAGRAFRRDGRKTVEVGDSLLDWKRATARIAYAADLWRAVAGGCVQEFIDGETERYRRERLGFRGLLIRLDDDDRDGRKKLAQIVNRELDEHATVRLLRDEERFAVRVRPRSFIGAAWLQLARAIDGSAAYRPCARPGCRQYIEISTRGAGRRADAKWCSRSCRQSYYRAKPDMARAKKAEGATVRKIARELEVTVEKVRAWIKTPKRKRGRPRKARAKATTGQLRGN